MPVLQPKKKWKKNSKSDFLKIFFIDLIFILFLFYLKKIDKCFFWQSFLLAVVMFFNQLKLK